MTTPDATTIELGTPLPDNALEARLTWRRDRGRLRGDEDVTRREATHAVRWVRGLDGKEREDRLELAEADRWVAEVGALHQQAAAKDVEHAQRRAVAQQERIDRAASIDLSCPHCAVSRRYAGRRNLVSLLASEHVAREDLNQLSRPQTSAYETYACPSCGSVEFFVAGALEHPLPGSSAGE
jgi:hypothetical protein